MGQTAPLFKANGAVIGLPVGIAVGKRKPDQGQKDQVVAQGKAGALPRAAPHGAAQPAVNAAIVLIFPQSQIGGIGTDIAQHTAPPI